MTGEYGAAVDPRLVRRLTAQRVRPGVIDDRLVRATALRRTAARDPLPMVERLVRRAAPASGAVQALPRVRAVSADGTSAGQTRTTAGRPVVGARRAPGGDRPPMPGVRLVGASTDATRPPPVIPHGLGVPAAAERAVRPMSGAAAPDAVRPGTAPVGTAPPSAPVGTAPPSAAQTGRPVVGTRAAARHSRSSDGPDDLAGLPARERPVDRLTAARPRPVAASVRGTVSAAGGVPPADGPTHAAELRSVGSPAPAVPVVRARRPAAASVGVAGVAAEAAWRNGTRRGPAVSSGAPTGLDPVSRASGGGSRPLLPLVTAARTGARGAARPAERGVGGGPRTGERVAAGAGAERAAALPAPRLGGHRPPAPALGPQPVPAAGTVVQAKRGAPSRAEPGGLGPATADDLVDRVLRRLHRDVALQAERRGVGR